MRLIEDAAGITGREVIPRFISVASPVAGADINIPVPGGVIWKVLSCNCRLTASAVVARRIPVLALCDQDGTPISRENPAQGLTALGASSYSWQLGLGVTTTGGASIQPVSDAFRYCLGGWSVKTLTANMDVADQYSVVSIYVLELWERPYDVELAKDLSQERGSTSNAYPSLPEGW